MLTGGGAMMKHIRQLAEFKTGLEVRLGCPNEYLSNETDKDLASPLYSTGIGLVIEGIAKYENDLRRGKSEGIANGPVKSVVADTANNVNVEEEEEGETRTSNFSLGSIITTISKIFKSENLDKDITDK